MAIEIERKFLLVNDNWRKDADDGVHMLQGYMSSNEKSSVRIRIHGDLANINIKSKTLGIERSEFEYPIPLEDAQAMLEQLCDKPFIDKTRYHVAHEGHEWEIDVFSGANEGLIVAEIELPSSDEKFSLPDWAGKEVSNETRYYNICLTENPYKNW